MKNPKFNILSAFAFLGFISAFAESSTHYIARESSGRLGAIHIIGSDRSIEREAEVSDLIGQRRVNMKYCLQKTNRRFDFVEAKTTFYFIVRKNGKVQNVMTEADKKDEIIGDLFPCIEKILTSLKASEYEEAKVFRYNMVLKNP